MGDYLFSLVLTVHVLVGLGVIGLVLVQHGKGADMGAAFGSGASGSLFGATGSANFLSRVTAALAAVFFISTVALAFFANDRPRSGGSLMEGVTTPASSVPSLPGSTPLSVPPAGSSSPASVPTAPGSASGASAVPAPASVPVAPAPPPSGGLSSPAASEGPASTIPK